MELYFSPFACSLAAHIACREAAVPFSLRRADFRDKRVEGGGDLRAVNPMGQVPTLVLEDGRTLTEVGAVLSFLADQAPAGELAPAPGDAARYELVRWLSFVATELHKKVLNLFFDPNSPEAVKHWALAQAPRALAVVDAHLAGRDYLLGARFSVADVYLYWALLLLPRAGVSLDPYEHLRALRDRVGARPRVREVVALERAELARPFGEPVAPAVS